MVESSLTTPAATPAATRPGPGEASGPTTPVPVATPASGAAKRLMFTPATTRRAPSLFTHSTYLRKLPPACIPLRRHAHATTGHGRAPRRSRDARNHTCVALHRQRRSLNVSAPRSVRIGAHHAVGCPRALLPQLLPALFARSVTVYPYTLGGPGRWFPERSLTVYPRTRTHSPHPPPWPALVPALLPHTKHSCASSTSTR